MDGVLPSFLRCPLTRSPLRRRGDGALVSSADPARAWPVVHGIPDFRLFDPPYMTREAEREAADRIAAASGRMDFEALVRFVVTEIEPPRPAAAVDKDLHHRLGLRERSPARLAGLFAKAGDPPIPQGARVLDLGCGSGEAVAALVQRGAAQVVGIDVSLVELLLARKLLEETGVEALLVAGCAEGMPFADTTFDLIYSPDVIEHVTSQEDYLAEAHRTLKPGGRVLLNSPNRYSVVCPEPHVGIWGLGFLPRPLMDPCSRALGKGPYTGKRLVSLPELRRLVGAHFGAYRLWAREANPHAASLSGRAFHALSPASERLFAYVCNQHVVLAQRTH